MNTKKPAGHCTKATALWILGQHGLAPTEQTETYKGEWVEFGTSFYEIFGYHDTYKFREIFTWLGY